MKQAALPPEAESREISNEQPPRVPLDQEAKNLLEEIRKMVSWAPSEDTERQIAALKEQFSACYPGHERLMEIAVREGKAAGDFKARAFNAAREYGRNSPQVEQVLKEARAISNWVFNAANFHAHKGALAHQRIKARQHARPNQFKEIRPRGATSPVSAFDGAPKPRLPQTDMPVREGLHGSDIRALKPCPDWLVLIDETGSNFEQNSRRGSMGRFVAVVVPAGTRTLPHLPTRWHTSETSDFSAIHRAFQNLLDSEAGIVGLTVRSLPAVPGERWMDGVALLIDWILRLLPVEESTNIRVLVENRGLFKRGDTWPLVERECLRRLALAFPERAAKISLAISVTGKDDHPWQGYADIVANLWGNKGSPEKGWMNESKLRGACLVETDARRLLDAWDSFAQGVRMTGQEWWALLPEWTKPASLGHSLLDRIGCECSSDASRWNVYLDETRRNMALGAVDLSAFALSTDWLDHFKPQDASIPPIMRLAWLTVKLARSNHYGAAECAWENELAALAPTLLDEAAPLVCHADLHLAVSRTNRYDFEGAQRVLEKWEKIPVAVPGLRYWGQVRSSLGQHAAFQGRLKEAVALFDEAIKAFERLSDPAMREKEIAQTACYRAITLMDDASIPNEEVRGAVESVTGPLHTAVPKLAKSAGPADRYSHHLLLRWLIHRGDPALAGEYLAARNAWQSSDGHPWPLILIYRALLLHPSDSDAARRMALEAAERAFEPGQGPVVRLIGACGRAIAANWGEQWTESATELETLAAALPQALDRIAILRNAIDHPLPPLELLRQVLPFNFR